MTPSSAHTAPPGPRPASRAIRHGLSSGRRCTPPSVPQRAAASGRPRCSRGLLSCPGQRRAQVVDADHLAVRQGGPEQHRMAVVLGGRGHPGVGLGGVPVEAGVQLGRVRAVYRGPGQRYRIGCGQVLRLAVRLDERSPPGQVLSLLSPHALAVGFLPFLLHNGPVWYENTISYRSRTSCQVPSPSATHRAADFPPKIVCGLLRASSASILKNVLSLFLTYSGISLL